MVFSLKPSALRCSRCGKFVDWTEARLQVVCGCRPHLDLPPALTREATEEDRRLALELFRSDFGRTHVVSFGETIALEALAIVVAEMEAGLAGALAYRVKDGAVHIVALGTEPMWQRAGVGGMLAAEAELVARREGLSRLIVATTNDNLPALYFWQRHGYRLTGVAPGAVESHPDSPKTVGFADIPMRDEVYLEKRLQG